MHAPSDLNKVAWFATKGTGTNEAQRMATLLSQVSNVVELPFDKKNKRESFCELWRQVRQIRPALLVMEGTGLAGGLICMAARLWQGTPYVVSSGDAVGPFIRAHSPLIGPLFYLYEWALCALARGYIGWTPYLCGRAMTFGTKRTMTAPGWVIGRTVSGAERADWRTTMRKRWGIPDDKLVVGILGSLEWNPAREWCYGFDLVQAIRRVPRADLCVVVVGGGTGSGFLKSAAGELLGDRIFLPGPVDLNDVMAALSAFDVASLPQSLDGVGSYRYTTKLPEYAAAGLPVITNQIPMAYDLGDQWMWKLPGEGPWESTHLDGLVRFLLNVSTDQIELKRREIPELDAIFDSAAQVTRVTHFIEDLLAMESLQS